MRGALAVIALLFLLAVPAAAGADEAEQIYSPSAVLEVDLGLTQEAEESLEDEPDEDVLATFSARLTDGTPGGTTTPLATNHPVEVHLKGNVMGSFRPFATGKSAFKLKFKKTELFLGLRKMTLNNMVEDPSMLHETLTYGLFRALGVPAPRTGFAYLRVNGEDFGTYLDLESIDKVALERLYPTAGTLHLYEGEDGTDVDAEGVPKYEMDEGEEPRTDLEGLAAAVAATTPSFSERLAPIADLKEMTRMWAVEKYVSQWDGYSGQEGQFQPNNYYLHSDLAGVFQMLPWGTDLTWQTEERIGFDGPGGLLFNGCYAETACANLFIDALEAVQAAVPGLDPEALATSTAALLKPWQEVEEDESSRAEYSLGEIDDAVAEVHQYIAERPGELAAWLAINNPPEEPEESEEPEMGTPSPGPTIVRTPPPPPPPTLTREAVVRHPHSFTLRLVSSAAGRVSGQATMRTSEGDQVVCSDQAELSAPGTVALRCDLSAAARQRLAKRWLRFTVSAHLQATDGQVADLATVVRLPRG